MRLKWSEFPNDIEMEPAASTRNSVRTSNIAESYERKTDYFLELLQVSMDETAHETGKPNGIGEIIGNLETLNLA